MMTSSPGFLEARVYGPEPMFIDGGKRVRVRYRIEEGPQVILSGVRFTPEPTLPLEELLSVVEQHLFRQRTRADVAELHP